MADASGWNGESEPQSLNFNCPALCRGPLRTPTAEALLQAARLGSVSFFLEGPPSSKGVSLPFSLCSLPPSSRRCLRAVILGVREQRLFCSPKSQRIPGFSFPRWNGTFFCLFLLVSLKESVLCYERPSCKHGFEHCRDPMKAKDSCFPAGSLLPQEPPSPEPPSPQPHLPALLVSGDSAQGHHCSSLPCLTL